MSADNWTQCPRCLQSYHTEVARRLNEVAALYGTVPIDEFDASRKEVDGFIKNGLDSQFREDYETFLDDDGWVKISYRGFCRTCSLSFKFEHQEKVTW